MASMDDFDSGQWDALFAGDEDTRVVRADRSGAVELNVKALHEVPGVKGVVQVALDGVLQAHSMAGSPEQATAITAYLGASARQAGAVMGYKDFDHAIINFQEGGDPVLVFRQGASFIGLLLDGELAPTHILSRIQGRSGG
jgi:predicted regulator of Ras-like GTPase activity (Roadblock/LC7/MglB family)